MHSEVNATRHIFTLRSPQAGAANDGAAAPRAYRYGSPPPHTRYFHPGGERRQHPAAKRGRGRARRGNGLGMPASARARSGGCRFPALFRGFGVAGGQLCPQGRPTRQPGVERWERVAEAPMVPCKGATPAGSGFGSGPFRAECSGLAAYPGVSPSLWYTSRGRQRPACPAWSGGQ